MILKLIIHTLITLFIMALFLFLPVGTINWPSAWIFLLLQGGFELFIGFWLAKHDPELLNERRSFVIQRGQKKWDKVIMVLFSILQITWLPLIAFDVAYSQGNFVPVFVKVVGAILMIIGFYIFYLVFKENSYASPVVKIQKEREHKIVTTGPYHYVRHPMYSGSILYFIGIPLLLGSWYGLLFTLCLTILLIIRSMLEEKALTKEFSNHYIKYTKRVHYRFIPFIY
ncbi:MULTISPECIES: methyltransferase family protein [Legionella]|uniref:Isoprenylcysteine carboxylmethyltransferase family protein n=1 Tax=Legionella resiliens TaxID=2905958 RepID=A0ABS8X5Q6_9GAMM|nr:isoprenylcysteine carboxylmethyltransferase family protein [Legionella sp. PC1000]MCE0724164.1 isoprenylcysteine carboxylmethyltransferase family protein [Legionella sp. 9fVS26]MCE3533317.1 isoprenylcysteine carboxylmethyltransferase family protein [Legionella sp. 8cVS16]QLZ69496.1 isoprenylcysteine carboxylmethyltransferase family protein [Legionella sp. PC1000]